MKLERNANDDGRGKYAIIDNRTGEIIESVPGSEHEFFVLKLKDRFAAHALVAYVAAAQPHDPEYAKEVWDLAVRAMHHPQRKEPD